MKKIWSAAEATPYPFGPFYKLLLLTAQRREEVADLRWNELDLAKGTWLIPNERTKNHKEHLLHLSKPALQVLGRLPVLDSEFVFTTTLTTGISGYSKAKRKLDALARIDKLWRVHDLRRTAASGMAMLGVQPHIVERILNHISGSTGGLVGVYQRFEYEDERRRALLAWGQHIDRLVSDAHQIQNVLPFKAK